MEHKFIYLFCLTMQVYMNVSRACSYTQRLETYCMEKTLISADIVVYGYYRSEFFDSQIPCDKHVVFEVFCIFKSDGLKIPSKIILNGTYMCDSCHNSYKYLRPGKQIILSLENPQKSNQTKDWYVVYEPNFASAGGFKATPDNLQKAADICGLQSPLAPENSTFDNCPTTNKTIENCVNCGNILTTVPPIFLVSLCLGVLVTYVN